MSNEACVSTRPDAGHLQNKHYLNMGASFNTIKVPDPPKTFDGTAQIQSVVRELTNIK